MSSYKQPGGDDYPDAAQKHLDDARALLAASRFDGAGYHAGYVIECAIKTILLAELGYPVRGHDLSTLSAQVAPLATGGSPRSAPYVPNPPAAIAYTAPPAGWQETMRYRSPGDLDQATAQTWVSEAERIYRETVQQMRMDGVFL